MNIHKVTPENAGFEIRVYQHKKDSIGNSIQWDEVPEDVQEVMIQYAHAVGQYSFHADDGKLYDLDVFEQ